MSVSKRGGRRAAAVVGVITVTGLVAAVPAQAEPDIEKVQSKVDRLYHEAEQAQERYHDAALQLDALNGTLGSLKADQKRQNRRLKSVRDGVQNSIVRQYKGESISSVGQVVVSEDPANFLGQLATMQTYNTLQSALFADYTSEVTALELRQRATTERRAEIREVTRQLKAEADSVDAKLAEAEKTLDRLEAEERERLAAVSRGDHTRLPNVPASGRAAAAIKYAMAQVGDAYVYGAAGPNAFDCSGFTMMAWAQAGVSLPHSSAAQYGYGTKVSQGDLRPGDLVFYYSPISHVGLYIGNGQIVHAANPSRGVRVDGVFSMPYVGAVRPG